MSEDAETWWRGQAAGIPSRAPDPEAFPLWPNTTTTTVRELSSEPASRPRELPGGPPGRVGLPAGPGGDTGPDAANWDPDLDADPDAPEHARREVDRDFVDPAAHEAGATAVLDHLQLSTARLERTAAELSEAGELWPPSAMRVMRHPRDAARTSPPPKRPLRKVRSPRHPAVGLAAMLAIALLATFFAWTSAEPFWLDMGQGETGRARVTSCKGDGILRRCAAAVQLRAEPPVEGVPVIGAGGPPGTVLDARMRAGGSMAYAGNPTGLRLRWLVDLGLVLLCGVALCWATGASRLGRLKTRLAAYALTTAAPLVLALGVILASY